MTPHAWYAAIFPEQVVATMCFLGPHTIGLNIPLGEFQLVENATTPITLNRDRTNSEHTLSSKRFTASS